MRDTVFTYRLGVPGRLVSLLAAIAVLAAGSTALGSSSLTARLRLDASPIRPELALTSAQRAVGLMHRESAPSDGMLFVFPDPTTGGFWMKNTLVPLKIVFFDSAGRRVRTMRMTPCRDEPCAIYDPGRRYRFALELPATDRRPARRLGPLADLRRLSERAS
jgi:uncharacterized membrane protein (UPF0127 family)